MQWPLWEGWRPDGEVCCSAACPWGFTLTEMESASGGKLGGMYCKLGRVGFASERLWLVASQSPSILDPLMCVHPDFRNLGDAGR